MKRPQLKYPLMPHTSAILTLWAVAVSCVLTLSGCATRALSTQVAPGVNLPVAVSSVRIVYEGAARSIGRRPPWLASTEQGVNERVAHMLAEAVAARVPETFRAAGIPATLVSATGSQPQVPGTPSAVTPERPQGAELSVQLLGIQHFCLASPFNASTGCSALAHVRLTLVRGIDGPVLWTTELQEPEVGILPMTAWRFERLAEQLAKTALGVVTPAMPQPKQP